MFVKSKIGVRIRSPDTNSIIPCYLVCIQHAADKSYIERYLPLSETFFPLNTMVKVFAPRFAKIESDR